MYAKPGCRRLQRTALCLTAALTLVPTAACSDTTDDEPEKKSQSQSQQQSQPQTRPSIFDGSVIVGVKKRQPGFSTRSGYDYDGFETSMVDSLADYARFKGAEKFDLPSLRREEILQNGGRDMIVATYSITKGRDKVVDFTAPYFKTYQGLLVAEDDDSIKKLEDVRHKQVCTASGSTSDPDNANDEKARKATEEALGRGVVPRTRTDYKDCVQGLINGNFQAVWTDEIVLQGFAHAKKYKDEVKVVPGIEIGQQEWYGIGLHEGQVDDCRRLNKALKKFLKDDWRATFQSYFDELAEDQDFLQNYKPSPTEFEKLREHSCGADDK